LREEPRRRLRPNRPAHRPAAEASRQAAPPAPPPATDQFIGGCQAGFHNVPAPTPSGYRCVQNGY
jgi:hypothetical protein